MEAPEVGEHEHARTFRVLRASSLIQDNFASINLDVE